MAHVQNSRNGDSSDDDDEDEEEDPMEESLQNLVGNTIKELAPAAQVLCKKQLILWKLGRMGIFRVVDLQTMVDSDIQMVVAALSPTPQLFAFKLKQAVTALLAGAAERQSTSSQFSPAGAASTAGAVSTAGAASTAGATSPANATSPAGTTPGSGAFQTPPINVAPAATSVIATVKIGPQTYIGARQFTVTVATSFAELMRLAISGQSEVDRAKLEGLPVKVETFTGPQHLSTHKADASLSALVTDSISLGYRHIVFTHALPAQKPAARPSNSAFERMMGLGLPDRETAADEAELSFDQRLYNWLIDMCEEQGLGVRGDEKKECEYLLKATRDALQAIDGREGSFQYSRVPEAFKTYKVGARPVKRAKAPNKLKLASGDIQTKADKLRSAIDRHAFTRSPLWASFVGNCNELHDVLTSKFDKMRGDAQANAERRAVPTVLMATISAETIEPCEAGTIERYASLERKLLAMQNYDILAYGPLGHHPQGEPYSLIDVHASYDF